MTSNEISPAEFYSEVFPESEGYGLSADEEPTDQSEAEQPKKPCKGCQPETWLKLVREDVTALSAKVDELGGYVAGLGRQQQVLTEHQKQVADQQNWMAQQVKGFLDQIPAMMGSIPGMGKMLSKRMMKGVDSGEG